MYEAFYQLSADPFRLSPDAWFSFQHRTYHKAMTYMLHALHRAEGYIMITGQPGTGKTTLVNDLIRTLKPGQAVVGKIVSTQLSADELLNLVAYSFNLDVDGCGKAKVLVQVERFLKQQYQQRRRALLIIDEAQDMGYDALEELRLLTNILVGNHQLLQVFLVGQEQLRDTVNTSALEQLHQRVIASTLLEPLDRDDTGAYIKHRLRRVSWKGDPLISAQAYAMIQWYSHGIPRRINQICSRLFLHGCIEEKHRLGVADVTVVVKELQQELLLPMEVEAVDGVAPWSAEQNEETYEEEPQTSSPAPKTVLPCAKPLPATQRVEQKPSTAVTDTALHTPARGPVSVAGPGPEAGSNQAAGIRHQKHRWQLKLLALFAALDAYRSKAGILLRDRIGKLKLPALVAALDGYASKARILLRDRIGRTSVPMEWSRPVTALVLIAIILTAYFSNSDSDSDSNSDSDQPARDLETLALNQAGTQQPVQPATADKEVTSVPLQPDTPATEEQVDSDTGNGASEAVTKNWEREELFAAPVVENRQAPALELASMETSPPPSRLAIVDTDKTPTPETANDANAEQSRHGQDEPVPAREADPVIAPSQRSQTGKAADPLPVKPVPVKKVNVAPPLSKEEKIAKLLDHGWRSLRQDRLMVPKDNNAYHYFQRVRKLDPGNSDARSGIDEIVGRYTKLATDALDENDKKKAEQYVARGLSISPNNKGLMALRDQMHAPPVAVVAEQPPPIVTPAPEAEAQEPPKRQSFFKHIKAFFSRQQDDKLGSRTQTDEP